MELVRRTVTKLGELTATPGAFAIVLAYAMLWCFIQPESLNWHGAATLATWFMTLFIQRAEHRDTQAIQGKPKSYSMVLPLLHCSYGDR